MIDLKISALDLKKLEQIAYSVPDYIKNIGEKKGVSIQQITPLEYKIDTMNTGLGNEIINKVRRRASKVAYNPESPTLKEVQEKKSLFDSKNEMKTVIMFINKKCESLILSKYSRDSQRNIDRDCLHLKSLKHIDASRLSPSEIKLLSVHEEMGYYINKTLKIARKLKDDIRAMSVDELKVFDPLHSSHWEEVK